MDSAPPRSIRTTVRSVMLARPTSILIAVVIVCAVLVTQVSAAPAFVPGGVDEPQDLNKDGRYEDVNGNRRVDFADVTIYFNEMGWIAQNEPTVAFDYNGNTRVDFADVVLLFNVMGGSMAPVTPSPTPTLWPVPPNAIEPWPTPHFAGYTSYWANTTTAGYYTSNLSVNATWGTGGYVYVTEGDGWHWASGGSFSARNGPIDSIYREHVIQHSSRLAAGKNRVDIILYDVNATVRWFAIEGLQDPPMVIPTTQPTPTAPPVPVF